MQENGGHPVLPAHEHAEELLRSGEPGRARQAASAALDGTGPHAGLYLVLGRAHLAEDDDDHDEAAERAYRAGLDAFPDDLDLLLAHAEFGLAGDVMEQPGRRARGRRAGERLRELAPDSPQAHRLAASEQADGALPSARRGPSAAYLQRQDARAALTGHADLDTALTQTAEAAAAWPHDERLAVRAETLRVLAGPRAGLARRIVRAPYDAALVLALLVGGWLLAVPALGLPGYACAGALLFSVPFRHTGALLAAARRRVRERLPSGTAHPAPGAPGPAVPTRRDRTVLALALVVAVAAAVGSLSWQSADAGGSAGGPADRDAYPRYAAAPPKTLHGMREEPDEVGGGAADLLEDVALPVDADLFATAYRDEDTGDLLVAAGAVGDLRAQVPADLESALRERYEGQGESVTATLDADPGPLGGQLACVAHTFAGGGELDLCRWVDGGSLGTVTAPATDLGELAAATRALREATLSLPGQEKT
ncbi:hypothetical protein GTW43_03375 [Streptomyces sp. SID5785]|uniref:hypothetical protein n=1 Tax=Streptomyces sp. SID5785 TaxID=2690309 RepID=UPI0013615302|nr:hypothetical protein [Streptomyces sp. SID5785]MZD04126.1 hypothetical protein [Streptomyces sp. SID5785]